MASSSNSSARAFSMPSVAIDLRAPSPPKQQPQQQQRPLLSRSQVSVNSSMSSECSSNSSSTSVNHANSTTGAESLLVTAAATGEGRPKLSLRRSLTAALQEAQTAVQLDHLGKTTAALESYSRASALLDNVMHVCTSEEEQLRLLAIRESYQLRIEVLAAKAIEASLPSRAKLVRTTAEPFSESSTDREGSQGSHSTLNASVSHVTSQNTVETYPLTSITPPMRRNRSVSELKQGRPQSPSSKIQNQTHNGLAYSSQVHRSRPRSNTTGDLTLPHLSPSAASVQSQGGRGGATADRESDPERSTTDTRTRRFRDLLLSAKNAPLHLAPTIPLPPVPQTPSCASLSTMAMTPKRSPPDHIQTPSPLIPPPDSPGLHSPPLSPKKSSRRISPLVPVARVDTRDTFSLTPVFHDELPSPISPDEHIPLTDTYAEHDDRELFLLSPEFHDSPSSIQSQTPPAGLAVLKGDRDVFSLMPVFHDDTSTSLPEDEVADIQESQETSSSVLPIVHDDSTSISTPTQPKSILASQKMLHQKERAKASGVRFQTATNISKSQDSLSPNRPGGRFTWQEDTDPRSRARLPRTGK
ncbi:hypothetical protein BGZ83_008944 [Gryganskiella cystojenkinii]|nr:hypothetical protein BGZ83_008944 [Gryganskiella cystojenkinii]